MLNFCVCLQDELNIKLDHKAEIVQNLNGNAGIYTVISTNFKTLPLLVKPENISGRLKQMLANVNSWISRSDSIL